jgi:ribosomal protein S13
MKYVKTFENFNVKMTNEEILGLGKKIKELIANAKTAADKALNSMSDEEKEEVLAFGKEKGLSPEKAQVIINKAGVNSDELGEITNEKPVNTNESIKDTIISRLSALVAAPVSLISGIALIASSAQGWSSHSWTTKIHDVLEPILGQGTGPIGVLLLFLTFVFLFVGVAKWKTAK